jgi:hypothetical protein
MVISCVKWSLVRKVALVREGSTVRPDRVSALVSPELARRARRRRVPVVPALPWSDGLDRVDEALRET